MDDFPTWFIIHDDEYIPVQPRTQSAEDLLVYLSETEGVTYQRYFWQVHTTEATWGNVYPPGSTALQDMQRQLKSDAPIEELISTHFYFYRPHLHTALEFNPAELFKDPRNSSQFIYWHCP